MSYNTELESNNSELQEILNTINELPDAEPINVKRWDVLITTGVPSSGVQLNLITKDAWLAENRSNPNLCVVVLPKF